MLDRELQESEERARKAEAEAKLNMFWSESESILMKAPSGHKLKDVARYEVKVKECIVPGGDLQELDAERKVLILIRSFYVLFINVEDIYTGINSCYYPSHRSINRTRLILFLCIFDSWADDPISLHQFGQVNIPIKTHSIATRTITKNRFVSVRSHDTPRTESDKHCDQNKANVWAVPRLWT